MKHPMSPFIIGAALVSIFPIIFSIEDSIYDPSSVHPPKKTFRQRLTFWKKSDHD